MYYRLSHKFYSNQTLILYYRLSHNFDCNDTLSLHVLQTATQLWLKWVTVLSHFCDNICHRNVTGSPSSLAVEEGHRHTSSERSDWFHVGSRTCGRPASPFFILQFTSSWFAHPGIVTVKNFVSLSTRTCFVTSLCTAIVALRVCWHSVWVATLQANINDYNSYLFTFLMCSSKKRVIIACNVQYCSECDDRFYIRLSCFYCIKYVTG
jgi:hypothetical protein